MGGQRVVAGSNPVSVSIVTEYIQWQNGHAFNQRPTTPAPKDASEQRISSAWQSNDFIRRVSLVQFQHANAKERGHQGNGRVRFVSQ